MDVVLLAVVVGLFACSVGLIRLCGAV